MFDRMNNLNFYRAKLYKFMKKGDDRAQVRIMPFMADVRDSETDNLPIYPYFFKGEVIHGKTETDDGEVAADYVFVAASPDFQVGFILGLANNFQMNNTETKFPDSYSHEGLRSFLSQRNSLGQDFDYNHITIQNIRFGKEGGIVELFNNVTGDKYTMLGSGTTLALLNGSIYMRVGSPSKTPGTVKKNFSSIKMDASNITFDTSNFIVNAKKVVLGKHHMNALGTLSKAAVACDGINLEPVSNVYL